MSKRYILLLTISSLLFSCFEKDERIEPHEEGLSKKIVMDKSIYEYQMYFDLNSASFVQDQVYSSWDLGFESSEQGWHIIMNTSRFMGMANTGSTDFDAVNGIAGYDMVFDTSDGNLDSTVVGNWVDSAWTETPIYHNHVYVVDRGYNELGVQQGYKKITFTEVTPQSYTFKYADLNGKNQQEIILNKDTTVNFVLFSFDEGSKTSISEPQKQSWDLLFTKYSTILFESDTIPTPYLVRGGLLNPQGVEVAVDTVFAYNEITYDYIPNLTFSSDQDALGFEWKEYSEGVYTVVDGINYIVKDTEGFYFKLRFISFYNNMGEKGYPVFEIQRL